jgi:hypothetical protein
VFLRKIAIVGSKSLENYDAVYRILDEIISSELNSPEGTFVLVNGGEEGVDTMAAELVLSHDLQYEPIDLEECSRGCTPGKKYCFEHSYRPRSLKIAQEVSKVYRVYDEGCGMSTCEVTARFGEELGKQVTRIAVDLLSIAR